MRCRRPRSRNLRTPTRIIRTAIVTVTMVLSIVAGVFAQAADHDEAPAALSQDARDAAPKPATWKSAIADSFRLLVLEHSIRIALQEKTRQELSGPFVPDYVRSLRVPDTWGDGDGWAVNYVGHPMHGAAAGFIWLDHEAGSHDPQLGFSKAYWVSRGRATAWAAAYSLQFEFGPLSEASIGNVGMHPGTTGWVDHVVTPAGALGFLVAEDVVDRYVMTRIESWTGNRIVLVLTRMALSPSRTMSNAVQGHAWWARPLRPLRRDTTFLR